MKKESTYYFLLVSFIVALLTTNAYSLQFDSIHDRTVQKELVDVENGELNISVVFELDPNETSTHLLAPNDFNTFLQ
jgi:hypothetical protein